MGMWLKNARASAWKAAEIKQRREEGLPAAAGALSGAEARGVSQATEADLGGIGYSGSLV
ncbi:hypothetical protein [Streptomyces sp. NBC_01006]|uniref:hypothetical protein n=1 Tax=Streptomyces sp. NBC_01006 TaxID=2903716 RepID=UPI00386B32CC